jgi:hypothetical protein
VTTASTSWVVGIDLGQEHDYSAVVALEYPDRGQRTYQVRHAQRFPLGTRYSEVVDRIRAPLTKPPLLGNTMLAVDATSLGAPIVEQIEDTIPGTRCHPIVITAGDTVSVAGGRIRVPKRDLVDTTTVLLQNGRLRMENNSTQPPSSSTSCSTTAEGSAGARTCSAAWATAATAGY